MLRLLSHYIVLYTKERGVWILLGVLALPRGTQSCKALEHVELHTPFPGRHGQEEKIPSPLESVRLLGFWENKRKMSLSGSRKSSSLAP